MVLVHGTWSFAGGALGELMVNASTTPVIKIAPEYLGQESVRSQLYKAIEGGRLSRSLLLSGPTGSGRKSLAGLMSGLISPDPNGQRI